MGNNFYTFVPNDRYLKFWQCYINVMLYIYKYTLYLLYFIYIYIYIFCIYLHIFIYYIWYLLYSTTPATHVSVLFCQELTTVTHCCLVLLMM